MARGLAGVTTIRVATAGELALGHRRQWWSPWVALSSQSIPRSSPFLLLAGRVHRGHGMRRCVLASGTSLLAGGDVDAVDGRWWWRGSWHREGAAGLLQRAARSRQGDRGRGGGGAVDRSRGEGSRRG